MAWWDLVWCGAGGMVGKGSFNISGVLGGDGRLSFSFKDQKLQFLE